MCLGVGGMGLSLSLGTTGVVGCAVHHTLIGLLHPTGPNDVLSFPLSVRDFFLSFFLLELLPFQNLELGAHGMHAGPCIYLSQQSASEIPFFLTLPAPVLQCCFLIALTAKLSPLELLPLHPLLLQYGQLSAVPAASTAGKHLQDRGSLNHQQKIGRLQRAASEVAVQAEGAEEKRRETS